jgi:hypothetical protein
MRMATRTVSVTCVENTVQTLPEYAARVDGATYLNVGAASGSPTLQTALAPRSTVQLGTVALGTTQIQFDGTPTNPRNIVVLAQTAVAGEQLLVNIVPLGAIAARG